MRENFYIHNYDNPVNLKDESDKLIGNWNRRFQVIPESITYYEIYRRQDYFKGDCVIKPGDIVVDCGGNIGIFSSFAMDMGASRVLSFEPYISNYEINKKNNPNVEVFNLAVSNKIDDTIELLLSDTNGGHTVMEIDENRFERKNIFVKTITLDDIIKNNYIDHIDFLKVDTEGSELLIFEGLSDENLSKIRCISLEYHNNVFKYDENVYNNFQRRFNKLGFNTFTWILDIHTRMLYVSRGDIFKENINHKKF